MRHTIILGVFLVGGCASAQLNYNTVEISASVDDVYTRETLNNMSKFIDNQFAIPSQIVLTSGVFQTNNTISPSVTFPLTAQFAKTLTTSATALTAASANTLNGAAATLGGSNSAQQNYSVTPLNDANTLRNQQALYRHAVYGTPLIGYYRPPRIFFKDHFYDDPYYLQLPHCVLCADKQDVFLGEENPKLHVNQNLSPGKWLYWADDPAFKEAALHERFVPLGRYGAHELYIKQKDYNEGVLTNFVMFTLPNSVPAEVITDLSTKETVVRKLEVKGGDKGVRRVVPVVKMVPKAPSVSAPAATNQRFQPAERNFNLIVPQILPNPPQ